jgi:glycosidase
MRLIHIRLTALVLPLIAACVLAAPAFATKVTFRYQPVIGGVTGVTVAGSFNAWNPKDHPLADPGKTGIWSAEYDLPPGRVTYKFVVNGDQWMTDENSAETESDGLGGQNSVVVIGSDPLVVGYGTTVKKAAPAKMGLRRVTFKFRPEHPSTEAISLAGSFNDWTVGRTLATDPDGDGTYEVTLLLAPGTYQYKFVVGSGGWTQDKAGEDSNVDDGYGGKNSVRNVDDRFPAIAVKKGDGDVFADGIEHTQAASELNALGGGHVEFTARAHLDDVEGVDLVTWPGGKETVTAMRPVNEDKVFEYFRAEVVLPGEPTTYAFRYRDGAKSPWLGPKGLEPAPDAKFTFDPVKFPPFQTPDWVKNGIIYQIFPDRFRNGSKANDQDFHEWYYEGKKTLPASGVINPDQNEYYHLVKDWNDVDALTKAPHTPDHRDWMAFYGGDIAGVREKLDYLKSLGITIIYFNPIFEAKSTHKYDAADYRKIDPHFGTNEEFIAFVKAAHAKGIRIILDIVYNHCGNSNWAFKDAVEKGEKSPYWNWFEIKRWPFPAGWPNVTAPWKPSDYYTCWWNFGDLPDLNYDLSRDDKAEIPIRDVKDAQVNVAMVTYLLDATTYWLKDADCDGVRLDVPNEVPYWFWKLFNQRVKSVKPDAYICGELWGNASDYVRPGVYDAVMNYAFFRDPVTKFIGGGQGTAAEFDATLATGRLTYPSQAVAVMMNLIDSHDTVRFLTQAGGDPDRLKLACLFQMTYVGAPAIYYGDEVALEGQRDPDCRRPFPWNWEQDAKRTAMHTWYSTLANLRDAHAALRTGDFRTVSTSGMTYVYTRKGSREEFLVAMNAGRSPAEVAIDLAPWGGKVKAVDAVTGEGAAWSGTAKLSLPGVTGRVFQIVPGGAAPATVSTATPAKKPATAPGSAPAPAKRSSTRR